MNIGGKKLSDFPPVIIPIVRGEEVFYFQAKAVVDMTEFENYCPRPVPPMIHHKGQPQPVQDLTDKKFLVAVDEYAKKKASYMVIKSLSSTPDLKWEKVDVTNPSTYELYLEELKAFGLNDIEIDRIVNGVFEANGMNDAKIEEAKKRFLAMGKAQ